MAYHHFIECSSSNKLLILFTATGAPEGRFNFWGAAQALSDEANILLVQGWTNSWYQDGVRGLGSDLVETVKSIKDLCRTKGIQNVLCSGQSMGGYGALLFAGLIGNGAKAVAFGAETVLDLPHSQYSRKANRAVTIQYHDLAESFKGGLNAVLFAGEREPIDLYCAKHMENTPGVIVRSLRFVGHGPAGHLKNRERLVPLLKDILDGKPPPSMPEYGGALEVEGFPSYFYSGWCALRSKDYEKAARDFRDAIKLYPSSDEAHFLLGKSLQQAGDVDGAIAHYAISNSIVQRRDAMVDFAACLRIKGERKAALYVCKTVKNKWPEYAPAHYGEGLTYVELGNLTQARKSITRACTIDPNNADYRRRLNSIAKR